MSADLQPLRDLLASVAAGPHDAALLERATLALATVTREEQARRQVGDRLHGIAHALFEFASVDATAPPEVVGDGGTLDLVVACISRLSEEMLDQIQDRRRTEGLLEERVRTRTAEVEAGAERFRQLVESTHAVPWEAAAGSLLLTYVAPQAEALFGLAPRSLVGTRAFGESIHADDRARVLGALAGLAAGQGTRVELDFRIVRGDGRGVDLRCIASAGRGAERGEPVLRGLLLDVTDQKRLEAALRQAQKLESVGRLAAGVAHEINTPMQFVCDSVHFVKDAMIDLASLIARYSQLFDESGDRLPVGFADRALLINEECDLDYILDAVPSALDRALEGLGRVTVIVRSMKEFAHPDRVEKVPVNLNRSIECTLAIARNEYKYVADLETDLGEVPPVICHGGEINQVVLNLIVNAAHAIEDVVRGTEARGRIQVRTRLDGESVLLSISDTGGGIPDAIRERIFDPFFTTKGVGRGTGQGLAIARAVILEKHGGDLTFETEPGRGTTFHIRLPVVPPDAVAPDVAA